MTRWVNKGWTKRRSAARVDERRGEVGARGVAWRCGEAWGGAARRDVVRRGGEGRGGTDPPVTGSIQGRVTGGEGSVVWRGVAR